MVLEAELQYYEEQRSNLLAHHKGQYVLIKWNQLVGVFLTEEGAFAAGIEQLGNVPFLIQSVREDQEFVQQPSLGVGIISAHP